MCWPSPVDVRAGGGVLCDLQRRRRRRRSSISVFDGKRGQIIYRCDHADQKQSHNKPSNSGAQSEQTCQLLLTGPYRAISADGCVAIEINLRHQGYKNTYVASILLDVYDPETIYDKAFTKVVHTCTCEDSPSAEVTYALLSEAVEAVVEVKLLEQRDDHPVCVKIIARSDLGDVVLFESIDDDTLIWSSTTIPLTRSVVALSLMSSLKIEVDLRSPTTGETMDDSVECKPDLDNQHHLVGINGKVEVKIKWLD